MPNENTHASGRRRSAIARTLAVVIASALVGVLAKHALREVPPFTFVWLHVAVGGVLLTLYTFCWRRERIPRGLGRDVWFYIAWIGVGNFAVYRVLYVFALERLPVTTHAYLINFVGIATMLMSVVILRERPQAVQIGGTLLALGGLWLFFREIPAPTELAGVILVAVAVLALASTNNIARKLGHVTRGEVSNNVVSTVALWIGGGPVVLVGLISDTPPALPGWQSCGIIVLNGIVGIAVGMTVFNYVLRTLRSYEASLLASSGVVFTAILALPILGEHLAAHEIAGILAMLIGIWLVQVRRDSG